MGVVTSAKWIEQQGTGDTVFEMGFGDIYSGTNGFSPQLWTFTGVSRLGPFGNIRVGDWLYLCIDSSGAYSRELCITDIYTRNKQHIYAVSGYLRRIYDWHEKLEVLLATEPLSPLKKPDIVFSGNNLTVQKSLPRSILGTGFRPWTSYILGIAGVQERTTPNGNQTLYSTHLFVYEIGKPQINPLVSEVVSSSSPTSLQSQHLVAVFFQGDSPMVVFDLSTNGTCYLVPARQRPFCFTNPALLDDAGRYELAAIGKIKEIALAHAEEILNGGGTQKLPYV